MSGLTITPPAALCGWGSIEIRDDVVHLPMKLHPMVSMLFKISYDELDADHQSNHRIQLMGILANTTLAESDCRLCWVILAEAELTKDDYRRILEEIRITGSVDYMLQKRSTRYVLVGRLYKLLSNFNSHSKNKQITIMIMITSLVSNHVPNKEVRLESLPLCSNLLHTRLVKLVNTLVVNEVPPLAQLGDLIGQVYSLFNIGSIDDELIYTEIALLSQVISLLLITCMLRFEENNALGDLTITPRINRYFKHILL